VIRELAEDRDYITSDDLYDKLLMKPHDPNQIGAAFRRAARLGIIQRTGRITPSKRPEAKGRQIQLWSAAPRDGVLL
jgi:hypothetical protein